MDVGLSRDGCIPRWDVGDPNGEEVTWPDESVEREKEKRRKMTHFILEIPMSDHISLS